MVFNPSPDAAIRANNYLIVIGSDEQLKKLEVLAGGALSPRLT
jgi:K+/H+ antiporter YhaU regulatory subunit KhtT